MYDAILEDEQLSYHLSGDDIVVTTSTGSITIH